MGVAALTQTRQTYALLAASSCRCLPFLFKFSQVLQQQTLDNLFLHTNTKAGAANKAVLRCPFFLVYGDIGLYYITTFSSLFIS